jgi:hypothetical protein
MLKQLAHLSVEADGRYATAKELQFLKDYMDSVDQRMSAYEKIRDAEAEIIQQIEAEKQAVDPKLFWMGNRDITDICRRDMTNILRLSAAAVLLNDLDRLRDAVLLWYRTIVRSYNYPQYADVTYPIVREVVQQHLSTEESRVMLPALQLDHSILAS